MPSIPTNFGTADENSLPQTSFDQTYSPLSTSPSNSACHSRTSSRDVHEPVHYSNLLVATDNINQTISVPQSSPKSNSPEVSTSPTTSPLTSTSRRRKKPSSLSFRKIYNKLKNPSQRFNLLSTLFCELVHVLFVVSVYDFVKVNVGGGQKGLEQGYYHALHVINLEKSLGLFVEPSLQKLVLSLRFFLKFWNLYYVVGHFVITFLMIVFLAWKMPHQYQRFRAVFFFMNIVGVFFYAVYPLMPPRLVGVDCLKGPCPSFGFVDTLADGRYAIPINPTKSKAANVYAAMPSMHIAWSLCVGYFGLYQLSNKIWNKVLAVIYPICMLYCIIITANHYWLDAAGGFVTFFVTFAIFQFYPAAMEYGHGAMNGYDNIHYASWISIILAIGIAFMNPVILAKIAGVILGSYFVGRCISQRMIPFCYKKQASKTQLPV